MFASCPHNFTGCTGDPTHLEVMSNRGINFNASITHIPGGSCGFVQEITHVQLMKINEAFPANNPPLLSCSISQEPLMCSEGRVSLYRGGKMGLEFIFTLSSVNISDAGLYEVAVEVVNPSSGGRSRITKQYQLEGTAPVFGCPGTHTI